MNEASPRKDSFSQNFAALQNNLTELLKAATFAAAVKQYTLVTGVDVKDLTPSVISEIEKHAYAVAEEIDAQLTSGKSGSIPFRDILKMAADSELQRLLSTSMITPYRARKYALDIDMFGAQPEFAEQFDACADLYVNMLQGVGVNDLRAASPKQLQRIGKNTAVIQQSQLTITIDSYSKLKNGLPTGAKKLLDIGCIKLSAENHHRGDPPYTTSVSFSLEEYCTLRGMDISPRPTSTPEEAAAEKKRIDGIMHNARKKVNKELDALYSLSLSWSEMGGTGKARGRRDYADIRILQGKGIKNGRVHMQFTEKLTAYLVNAFIMPYPKSLLAMDDNNSKAYSIGIKLALHHGITHNEKCGTNHLISIRALLDACGEMPLIEEVEASSNRGHWRRLIQEPLETSLNHLVQHNLLTRWEYANSKGTPLTEDQLFSKSYKAFEDLFISFDMPDSHA